MVYQKMFVGVWHQALRMNVRQRVGRATPQRVRTTIVLGITIQIGVVTTAHVVLSITVVDITCMWPGTRTTGTRNTQHTTHTHTRAHAHTHARTHAHARTHTHTSAYTHSRG